MHHILIMAESLEAADARAAEYAPLRGVRTVTELLDRSDGSTTADIADLSLLPIPALHGAIRGLEGRCRAVLLPAAAALPADGERMQKLLVRNKLHGFIRNTMFLHPATARSLEVADGGCLGPVVEVRLTAFVKNEAEAAEAQALAALFALRYLPAVDVPAVVSVRTADENGPGWEICVAGDAGTIFAQAPACGGGGVCMETSDGGVRKWEVPVESPDRLCAAAALACLARKEPLAFLDFKAVAKTLAALSGG